MRKGRKAEAGFTLVEIMIVVLIIGLLLAIAIPQWVRARERARHGTCVSNLRLIDHAKEQFAMENNLGSGAPCTMNDLWPDYIRNTPVPQCPASGTYTIGTIGEVPQCSYNAGAYPHMYP